MKKCKQVAIAAVAVIAAGSSWAQNCTPCGGGTAVTAPGALANLLGGKTVCASVGNDTWQEFHSGNNQQGGPLIDYKKGPNDPVDPTKTVGTWSISNGQVVYSYTGGSTYAYTVCQPQNSPTVNFCGATNITGATLVAGQTSCQQLLARKKAAG